MKGKEEERVGRGREMKREEKLGKGKDKKRGEIGKCQQMNSWEL